MFKAIRTMLRKFFGTKTVKHTAQPPINKDVK
jgi:hypothetical protein